MAHVMMTEREAILLQAQRDTAKLVVALLKENLELWAVLHRLSKLSPAETTED